MIGTIVLLYVFALGTWFAIKSPKGKTIMSAYGGTGAIPTEAR